jgi:hypothetical protein
MLNIEVYRKTRDTEQIVKIIKIEKNIEIMQIENCIYERIYAARAVPHPIFVPVRSGGQ